MRARVLTHLTALLLLAACQAASDTPDSSALVTAVPATVECADAGPLRQRAADDHRRMAEVSSQQAQVLLGSRANFMASFPPGRPGGGTRGDQPRETHVNCRRYWGQRRATLDPRFLAVLESFDTPQVLPGYRLTDRG